MTLPQLPPAVEMILPALAADAGRFRARTLLAIMGAGIDDVDRHRRTIDATLGDQSPGEDVLAQLVQQTRSASSVGSPTVPRQHVISQALLRRFTEVVDPRAGQQLARLNLRTGKVKLTGPGGAGYVENFVTIDSAATETVWKTVEDSLTDAIVAAENGTVLSDSFLSGVLRNAIALHYIRNPQVRDVHERVFADTYAAGLERWAQTPWAAEAFRRTYGLEPAGPEAMRLGAASLLGRIHDRFNEGVIFRLRVQDLFETVCDRFSTNGIEVLSPASTGKEFLIGDVPALTVNFATGAAGVAEGVALGDANTIILPFSPRVLVALGPADHVGTLADEMVDTLNALQVRAASANVQYRPGAGLNSFVVGIRPPVEHLPIQE